MEHLHTFSNTFGGRLVGSDAYENSVEWAAYMLEQWGLEVEIQEVGDVPVGFNRGPWFGRMLDTEGMTLNFTTPSYTVGTKGVQRGHVLAEPKTRRQFETMKHKLNGAWVLITGTNSGWPIDYSEEANKNREEIIAENEKIEARNREITAWNRSNPNNQKPLEPLKDEPALFYQEMVDAGILGIIQSSRVPITTLYDRKNINNKSLTFFNLPKVPDIKLDEAQFKVIAEKVRRREYFQLEFDIRNHFKMGPIKYHNVIATIKGSKKPNEYIIHGGHLDAYDVATGGVDCGTGIAPTMEAARLISKAMKETGKRPERTLVFILFAAEEFGLLGSKRYVSEIQKNKNVKIINYFNRDGGPTVADGLGVPDSWYDTMDEVCTPLYGLNEDLPFTLRRRQPTNKPTVASGTDSGPFAVQGIPTLNFSNADPLGYNCSYSEIWHTERDTYDKSIKVYMDHTSIVTAVVMWGMSNVKQDFNPKDVYKQ